MAVVLKYAVNIHTGSDFLYIFGVLFSGKEKTLCMTLPIIYGSPAQKGNQSYHVPALQLSLYSSHWSQFVLLCSQR